MQTEHSLRYELSQLKIERPLAPYFAMRKAVVDARQAERARRHAEIDADFDPEFEALLERFYAPAVIPKPANEDAPAPARGVGHPVNRKRRVSDVRSKLTRDRTRDFLACDLAERGIAFSGGTTSLSNHTNDNSTHRKTPRDTRRPEDWQRASEIGKLTGYQRATFEFGEPWAWTLNLNPDVVIDGIASGSFASWLLKRIARHLRIELGRDLVVVLAIDVAENLRPHAHGGIACTAAEIPAVRRALRRAGGPWGALGSNHQVKVRRQFDPDGWTAYSERNLAAARKVVGSSVIAASGDLKVAAKAMHGRLRRKVIAAAA